MKRTTVEILTILLLGHLAALSQPRVVTIEKLPLDTRQSWESPRFSPDGTSIFVTTSNFDGIWQYSIAGKSVREITSDPSSGSSYSIAPDGSTLAYRRTRIDPVTHERHQEIIIKSLVDDKIETVASGRSLTSPAFSESRLLYSVGPAMRARSLNNSIETATVLGIEDTKIALLRNGRKELLDPLGHGSYIWPALSPDRSFLVAYEMDRGTFVATVNGDIVARLGRRDAPQWTFDGRWIIFMDDRDDGEQILSSEISFITPDGTTRGSLTATPDDIELNPRCSPTERKIVFNTLSGSVYLLTYSE